MLKYLLSWWLLFFCSTAFAQYTCPTAPAGASDTRCASTAFVSAATGVPNTTNSVMVGTGNGMTSSGNISVVTMNATSAFEVANQNFIGTVGNSCNLWPETVIPGTCTASQFYSITTGSQAGYIGGNFSTRTSDAPSTGGVTEGVQIIVVNDKTSSNRTAWGLYIQGEFTSTHLNGQQLFGQEISISNANSVATEDPYAINSGGWVHGLRIDCLNISSSNSCQNALDIVPNTLAFSSGIVFSSTALDTTAFTHPPALSLPSGAHGYGIYWYEATATPEWVMYSSGTSGSVKYINLQSSAFALLDSSSTTDFNVLVQTGGQTQIGSSSGTNCGNYLQLAGQVNGQPAIVSSQGCSDTNVSLDLGTKGTGTVQVIPGSDGRAFAILNAAQNAYSFYVNTSTGLVTLPQIATDATHTDATVCEDTTSHSLYFGSGAAGICLGTSSVRFKHDIRDLNVGLKEIMNLRAVSYFLNADHGDPNKLLYGFTADQGVLALPKLVEYDSEGRPNTFDYVGVVPVLVRAMQEQETRIEALEERLR